jgi:hypothetical protein
MHGCWPVSSQTEVETEVPAMTSDLITPEMELAARAVGVSPRAVERAGKLREKAAPEIIEAVELGILTLGDALTISGLKTMEWFYKQEKSNVGS